MADNIRKLIGDGSVRGYFDNSSSLLDPQQEWTLAFWYRNTSPKRNTNDSWPELDRALVSKRMGSNIGTQIFAFQHGGQPYPSNNAVMVFNIGEGTYSNFAPVSSDYMTDATLYANQPDPFDGDWHHVVLRNVNVGGTMMNQLIIDGFNYLKELANMNMAVWSWVEHGMVSGTASNNAQVAVLANPHNSAQPPAFESNWFADDQEMDEIAIFGKALSDAEVDEIRAANNYGASSVAGDLIVFTRAGDGAGDTDTRGEDQSTNDHDLILSNGQFGYIDASESIFDGTVVSANNFATPDESFTENFSGWTNDQYVVPESFDSPDAQLTENFSGWTNDQYVVPESFTSPDEFISEIFSNDWSAPLAGASPEDNDMAKRLYLKSASGEGTLLVADLGLKISEQGGFVAISDHEALQPSEKPLITPSECRSSSSLRALIELDKIEFSFDGTSYAKQSSAAEKWSPELLLVADLSDADLVATKITSVTTVDVGGKLSAPEIELDGSDLAGELSGLDSRLQTEEGKSDAATTDRGAIRQEVSDLVGAKIGANIAADMVAAEARANSYADTAEQDAKDYADGELDALKATSTKTIKQLDDEDAAQAVRLATIEGSGAGSIALAKSQAISDAESYTDTELASHEQAASKVTLAATYDGTNTKISASDGKLSSALASVETLIEAIMDDDDAVLSVKAPAYKAKLDIGSSGNSKADSLISMIGNRQTQGSASGLAADVEANEGDIAQNAGNISSNASAIATSNAEIAKIDGAASVSGSFREADAAIQSVLDGVKSDVDGILANANGSLDTFKEISDWLDENVDANASALTSENILPRLVAEEAFTADVQSTASGKGASKIAVDTTATFTNIMASNATNVASSLEKSHEYSYWGARVLNGALQPNSPNGLDEYVQTFQIDDGSLIARFLLAEAEIVKFNGAANIGGSIAEAEQDAKDHAQDLINALKDGSALSVKDLEDKCAVIQGSGAGSIAEAEQEAKNHANTIMAALKDTSAKTIKQLDDADIAMQARLDVIEGAASVSGSVAKAQSDAQSFATGLMNTLMANGTATIEELEDEDTAQAARLGVLEGSAAGSVAKAQSDAQDFATNAVSVQAAADAAARAAMVLEHRSASFSQDGYVASMYLRQGMASSNESSERFSSASTCHEVTVGTSESQAADCVFKVRVVGDDGSVKHTEEVTLSAGSTFAQKSFSASAAAGDRISVESVGLCKDPHCAVEYSKDV